jgi:hypothetical protein
MVASALSHSCLRSSKPIFDCCHLLHSVYVSGLFANICKQFADSQTAHSYEFVRTRTSARLIFPPCFAPANIFSLRLSNSSILLCSTVPMFSPETDRHRLICYRLTGSPGEIPVVLSEIRSIALHTRLRRLWSVIVAGMNTIGIESARSVVRLHNIDIFCFDSRVCVISLDSASGEAIVRCHSRLGLPPSVLIEAIQGCSCQRNEAIRAVFMNSLGKLIGESVIGARIGLDCRYQLDGGSYRPHAFMFSFAPSLGLSFHADRGRVSVSIRSFTQKVSVSTQEIILLQNVPHLTRNALASAKMAMILLELSEVLHNAQTVSTIESDRVHFPFDPFECVEFRITRTFSWSLTFVKPWVSLPSDFPRLRLVGHSISVRFPAHLLRAVDETAMFVKMMGQLERIHAMETIKFEVDLTQTLAFTVSFYHPFCTSLSVCFGRTLDGPTGDRGHFAVRQAIAPSISFKFWRHIHLKWFIDHLLESRSIAFCLGPFLNGAFIPLQRLSSVFTEGPNAVHWTVTPLQDDHSFFLIYQRSHTVNLLLKSSHSFQLIVPSIGHSTLLQIPLETLSQFKHNAKLSHTTLRIHMSQLDQVKDAIERFFYWKHVLAELGFKNFRFEEGDLDCSLPRSISGLKLRCLLKPTTFLFEVDGDGDLARNLKLFLNYDFGTCETQILVVRFVLNLLDLDVRFFQFVMQFIARMLDLTETLGVNWAESMSHTVVTLQEMKVIFNFVSARGLSCGVEFTKHPTENVPDILGFDGMGNVSRFKSLRDLVNWIEGLEAEMLDSP